jgi:Ca2+-dependent lipid-binding protein
VISLLNKDPLDPPKEVLRTEVIKSNLNPKWQEIVLSSKVLGDDINAATLQFHCYDWDSPTKSELIGSFIVCNSTLYFEESHRDFFLFFPSFRTRLLFPSC